VYVGAKSLRNSLRMLRHNGCSVTSTLHRRYGYRLQAVCNTPGRAAPLPTHMTHYTMSRRRGTGAASFDNNGGTRRMVDGSGRVDHMHGI